MSLLSEQEDGCQGAGPSHNDQLLDGDPSSFLGLAVLDTLQKCCCIPDPFPFHFLDRVSYILGWPPASFLVEGDLVLLLSLPFPAALWRLQAHADRLAAAAMLGTEVRVLSMLNNHSAN